MPTAAVVGPIPLRTVRASGRISEQLMTSLPRDLSGLEFRAVWSRTSDLGVHDRQVVRASAAPPRSTSGPPSQLNSPPREVPQSLSAPPWWQRSEPYLRRSQARTPLPRALTH